jgi:hypothetical protein
VEAAPAAETAKPANPPITLGMRVAHEGKTVYVADDPAASPQRLTLDCPDGLAAGARVQLILQGRYFVSAGMTGSSWTLQGVEVLGGGRVVTEKEPFNDFFSLQGSEFRDRPRHYPFVVVRVEEALKPGAKLAFNLVGRPSVYAVAPIHGLMWLEVARPGWTSFSQVGQAITISLVPAMPARVHVRLKPMPNADGLLTAAIFMTDAWENPVRDATGLVRIEAGEGLENVPAQLDWRLAQNGVLRIPGIRHTGQQAARLKVTDATTGTTMLSPPASIPRMATARCNPATSMRATGCCWTPRPRRSTPIAGFGQRRCALIKTSMIPAGL